MTAMHISTITDVQANIAVMVLAPAVQSRGDKLRLVVLQHGLDGGDPLHVDLQQQVTGTVKLYQD